MTNWFQFLDRLMLSVDSEMTSLVTSPEWTSRDAEKADMSQEIRLDWWIHVGGVVRRRLEEKLAHAMGPRSDVDAAEFAIRLGMKVDPVLRFEIENWLQKNQYIFSSLNLNSKSEAWNREIFFQRLAVGPKCAEPEQELRLWSEVIRVPSVFSDRIEIFSKAMSAADVDLGEPPWIFWSRFVAWIKRDAVKSNPAEFSKMDLHLAFLRAALSPQDEVSERQSLDDGMVMVNPTFEICELIHSEPLLVLARNFDIVVHRPLVELEAQILDQVRESFRVSRGELLKVISTETGIQKEFVNRGIESLIADSFLLENSKSAERSVSQ